MASHNDYLTIEQGVNGLLRRPDPPHHGTPWAAHMVAHPAKPSHPTIGVVGRGTPQSGFIQHGGNWYFRNVQGNMSVMPHGWHPGPQHHILQGAHTAGWNWGGAASGNLQGAQHGAAHPPVPGATLLPAAAPAPASPTPAPAPAGGDAPGQSLYSALMNIILGY